MTYDLDLMTLTLALAPSMLPSWFCTGSVRRHSSVKAVESSRFCWSGTCPAYSRPLGGERANFDGSLTCTCLSSRWLERCSSCSKPTSSCSFGFLRRVWWAGGPTPRQIYSLLASSVCWAHCGTLWALTAVSGLAMSACLAVSVFPGLSTLLPRLASRVTVAARADARGGIYPSTQSRRSSRGTGGNEVA